MHHNQSSLLPTEEFGPLKAKKSIIWLHGLGASGHDFVPIMPMLNQPQCRFVFPHAPMRSVTINMGHHMPAWYDILRLDAGPGRESEQDILTSTAQIHALIDHEIQRGVLPQHIVLAGFSQGGAMALHAGIRYAKKLAGIIVLSAYDLRTSTRAREATTANSNTPILFCHGSRDPVVSIHKGQQAYESYRDANRDAQWRTYEMAHEVCDAEIILIRDWLAARLP